MTGPATTAPTTRAVRSLSCPSCGAAIVLRGLSWTQSVACASCGAVLNARDPNLAILQRAHERMTVVPRIPLGTRGEWKGAPYDVIGMQQRTITADGDDYSWREYLLFNPYHGFRYLTEYDGHWNDVVPLRALPTTKGSGATATATYDGRSHRLFQTAQARTTFVVGEFPWEIRVGDTATTQDYVAPPHVLSAESTSDETTWSFGTYVDPASIWKAFALPGSPPRAVGVYSNQPSPYAGTVGAWWRTFAVLALLCLGALIVRAATADRARAYRGDFTLEAPSGFAAVAERSGDSTVVGTPFVTPRFTLDGATANVAIDLRSNVDQEWLTAALTLVNEATGETWPLTRTSSYYSGVDSDGSWSEGSRSSGTTIGGVPGGPYVLRVEPAGQPRPGRSISYSLTVTRDVPAAWPYLAVLLVLLVPPIVGSLRAANFETQRWAESDAVAALREAAAEDDDDE